MTVDPDFGQRVGEAAFAAAVDFFRPSPEWTLTLVFEALGEDTDAEAQLWQRLNYLRAQVVVDLSRHDDGAHIWRNVGHEVAHMLLYEYDALQASQPKAFDELLTQANEHATTRLQRLFERERPYPGDDAFAAAPAVSRRRTRGG